MSVSFDCLYFFDGYYDGYCHVDSWMWVLGLMVTVMVIISVSFVMSLFDGYCDVENCVCCDGESCVCYLIVTSLFDGYCDGDSWVWVLCLMVIKMVIGVC